MIFVIGSFLLENIGGVLDILFSGYFDGTGYGSYAFFLSFLYLVLLSFKNKKKIFLLLPVVGFVVAIFTVSLNTHCGLFGQSYGGLLTADHFYFYLAGGVITLIFWKFEVKSSLSSNCPFDKKKSNKNI